MLSTNHNDVFARVIKAYSHGGVNSGRMYTFHPSAPYLYFIMNDPARRTSGFYECDYSRPGPLKPRLVGAELLGRPTYPFSKEEALLRERQREGLVGVTTYTFNAETHDFLIPSGRSLVIYNVTDPARPRVRTVWADCAEPRMDPKLSADGRFVTYVYDSDLWVLPLHSNTGTTITDAVTCAPTRVTNSKVRPHLRCACADYILEEEFSLYTGYFVCPRSVGDNVYRILYFEDDDAGVEDFAMPSYSSYSEAADVTKYPRVGTPNPRVTLCMMDVAVSTDGSGAVRVLRVGRADQTLRGLYPRAEYFTRLGWTRDGKRIYVQLVDRRQRSLALVLIDADAFFGEQHAFAGAVTVVKEQTDEHWINIFNVFEELEDGSFIWASEEHPNGFMRLVRLIPNSTEAAAAGKPYKCVDLFESSEALYAMNGTVVVDEKSKLIAFTGYEESPLQVRCFVVPYGNSNCAPSKPIRVSSDKFSISAYGAKFYADGKSAIFAFEQSSFDIAPFAVITHANFASDNESSAPKLTTTTTTSAATVGTLFEPTPIDPSMVRPQAFSFVSKRHGERLYGCYFAPRQPMSKEKCPVVVSIYGGTHTKIVGDDYRTASHEQRQLYAAEGMYVVCLDNVGSFNRGHKFESHIDEKMGTVELLDQIDALHYLAEDAGLPIDLDRVAIFGWSYGGYMSLMAIAQHPEVFKVALAGAPVTLWEAYDTAYTERYMGIPTTDAIKQAYDAGSVLTYAKNIPKDKARIAIVHGLSDENVHFVHTSIFMNKLQEMCTPFELRIFPDERHCFRKFENVVCYQTFYLEFLLKNI